MGGLFSTDGIIYKISLLIWDMLLLNILWVVFSLPIVTMGASTTALFYVCGKRVNGEEGYIFRDFWKSFKMNFKQSTVLWIILLLITALLLTDYAFMGYMGNFAKYFMIVFIVVSVEVFLVSLYIFPVLSKFYIKTTGVVKTSFFMANKHFLTTILCVAILALDVFIVYNFSFMLMFMFSGYAYAASFLFQRIFDKYIPEEHNQNYDDEEYGFKNN